MNLGRLLCAIRGHDWSRWRTRQAVPRQPPTSGGHFTVGGADFGLSIPGRDAYQERKCKRCDAVKTRAPLRRPRMVAKRELREVTSADTTQGKP